MCFRPRFPLLILCWDMYCTWLSCADSLLRHILYLTLTYWFFAEACTFIGNPLKIRCWDVYSTVLSLPLLFICWEVYCTWITSADSLLRYVVRVYLTFFCFCLFDTCKICINTIIRTELKLNVHFLSLHRSVSYHRIVFPT